MNGFHMVSPKHSPNALSGGQSIILDDSNHSSELLKQLNIDRSTRIFTDAIISVDQEDFPCHRCILAASSPYFEASFSNNFQEGLSSRLVLRDIGPWIVKRLIEYIYTGRLEISLDTAQDYLRAGHMLTFPHITESCCQLLEKHLHPSNCIGIREFALMYDCEKLETTAFKYSLEHFDQVLSRPVELCHLTVGSLLSRLENENIEVLSEMYIWTAIKTWIMHEPETRASSLPTLFESVRLSALNKSQIGQLVTEPLVMNSKVCLKRIDDYQTSQRESQDGDVLPSDAISCKGLPPRPSTVARAHILLFGSNDRAVVSEVIAIDTQTHKLFRLPKLPDEIVNPSITTCHNCIYVIGGIVDNELSDRLWKYDPEVKFWTRQPDLPRPRVGHASIAVNDVIFVMGGIMVDEKLQTRPNNSINLYDIPTQTWTSIGEVEHARMDAQLITDGKSLFLIGGANEPNAGAASSYNYTMEKYHVKDDHTLDCTDGHYILPGEKQSGAIRSVFHQSHIYLHWEKTGEVIRLDPYTRVYRSIAKDCQQRRGSSSLVVNNDVMIIGGTTEDHSSIHLIERINSNDLTMTRSVTNIEDVDFFILACSALVM